MALSSSGSSSSPGGRGIGADDRDAAGHPGLAAAEPARDPDGIARLIADVAEANQQLQDLGAQIAQQKESVNKALVDLQTAREDATAAQQEVEAGRQAIADADAAIVAAQQRFNTFAASTYVNGPSESYLTARDPSELMATAAAARRWCSVPSRRWTASSGPAPSN